VRLNEFKPDPFDASDPENGWVYDELTHSIRFQGAAKQQAFAAEIDITYEEHR